MGLSYLHKKFEMGKHKGIEIKENPKKKRIAVWILILGVLRSLQFNSYIFITNILRIH